MDRCALFVDAGYVLADGAMAARGASRPDAVSWDYAGLLQFLSGLASDRTGLPLLRCYWYEATVDGRRTPEHDTLADLPGLTLRVGRLRPGKREGVETEIHRDLTALARNRAVSDVLLVSAEEDLAQVMADVQDLGVRATIVHISVDGNWTVSRSLRQQCDDIVEIQGAQLRPYAELASGAEAARYPDQYAASIYGGRPLSNGHAAGLTGGHQPLPAGSTGAHPAPPAIYTAPVVAEYPQPSQAQAPAQREQGRPSSEPAAAIENAQAEAPPFGGPAASGAGNAAAGNAAGSTVAGTPAPPTHGQPGSPMHSPPGSPGHGQPGSPGREQPGSPGHGQPGFGQHGRLPQVQPLYAAPEPVSFHDPHQQGQPPTKPPAPELPAAQGQAEAPAAHPVPPASAAPSSAPPPGRHQDPPDYRAVTGRSPYEPPPGGGFPGPAGPPFSPVPPEQFSGAPTGLPNRRGPQQPQRGQPPHRSASGSSHVPPQAPYSTVSLPGPGSSTPGGVPPPPTGAGLLAGAGALADNVQAAHAEGFGFGESVARDAPALWLEAVLARRPRMPTDLEARLLQGSTLPIDSLLHDEVRHALRRGFWDALERSRR